MSPCKTWCLSMEFTSSLMRMDSRLIAESILVSGREKMVSGACIMTSSTATFLQNRILIDKNTSALSNHMLLKYNYAHFLKPVVYNYVNVCKSLSLRQCVQQSTCHCLIRLSDSVFIPIICTHFVYFMLY